jgi:hypothetical protein
MRHGFDLSRVSALAALLALAPLDTRLFSAEASAPPVSRPVASGPPLRIEVQVGTTGPAPQPVSGAYVVGIAEVVPASGAGRAEPLTSSYDLPPGFFTVTACRLFDSREVFGGPTPFAAGSRNTVAVAGHCGISTTAAAVSLNVTVTAPTAQGHVRLFSSGAALPLVSTINYVAGQTRANNAITALGAAGALDVYVGQSGGSVHVIIDVNGYFECTICGT